MGGNVAQRSAELYGRERIRMFVNDALDRQRHRKAPTLPVVLVIGPGGYGKTKLLEDIAGAHTGNAPTALLDIARDPDTTPAQFMFAVAKLMGERVSGIGSARFPRLLMGIRTVTLRPDGKDPAEQLEARLRARRWIHGSSVVAVADGAAKLLPSTVPKPIVTEGGAVLGWLIDRVGNIPLDKQLEWYSRDGYPEQADGSEYGPLLALYDRWQESQNAADKDIGRAARLDVWRVLCRALLADLRAYANRALLHGERTTNCLLLLDNADAGVGKEFLEILAETRQRARELTDPLLVVAAQGTTPGFQPEAGEPISSEGEDLSYAKWLERTGRASPWYPVRLTGLSLGDVRDIVTTHVLGQAEYDAKFVHEVTDGYPAAARAFDTRLTEVPSPVPDGYDLRGLVKREFEDILLGLARSRGEPSDQRLNELAVFGITLNPRPKAGQNVFRALRWEDTKETEIVGDFLRLLWADSKDGRIKVRPFHRLLLTRWLARNATLWQEAHEAFVTYYQSPRADDPDGAPYHQLALTTMASPAPLHDVVKYLNEQFSYVLPREVDGRVLPAEMGQHEWNEKLKAITTAPNRLVQAASKDGGQGAGSSLPLDPRNVVQQLVQAVEGAENARQRTGTAEDRSRLLLITRVLVARWLFNDRLFDPKCKTASQLADGYRALAEMAPGASEVFYRESDEFNKIKVAWEGSW